jgi:hypothetical protein
MSQFFSLKNRTLLEYSKSWRKATISMYLKRVVATISDDSGSHQNLTEIFLI